MSRAYTIDVIAGDGIGKEVMPAALGCLEPLAALEGFSVEWRERDWGSERYRADGRMMPKDGIEQLADGDGILLGAVGAPDIPDHVTLCDRSGSSRACLLGSQGQMRSMRSWFARTWRASIRRSGVVRTPIVPKGWRSNRLSSPARGSHV